MFSRGLVPAPAPEQELEPELEPEPEPEQTKPNQTKPNQTQHIYLPRFDAVIFSSLNLIKYYKCIHFVYPNIPILVNACMA